MLYANPPFSKILHTLVKVYMDQATVALVIPEGMKWEEKEKLWGPIEAVWGASPIPAAQPVALFARPDQEFSC